MFENAVIIYRPGGRCLDIARRVVEELKNRGIDAKSYWVDDVLKHIIGHTDLVVSIGGDGTLLRISRLFQEYSPLILPIPCGRRTAYYEELNDDVEEYIDRIFRGEYYIETLDRVMILYNGKRYKALNEAALINRDRGRVLHFNIQIRSPAISTKFTVEADGILIGPSSGSSAYNLSAYGPLLNYDLHAMFLTILYPMELNIRTIVVPMLSKIDVRARGYIDLFIDGESIDILGPENPVEAQLDYMGLRIIRFYGKRDYVREVFDKRKIVFG